MRKFLEFTTLILATLSLSTVSVSAKSKRTTQPVRISHITNNEFNADMRLNILKSYRYLGISSKDSMSIFLNNLNVKQMNQFIGSHSKYGLKTSVARFNTLIRGYRDALKANR